MLLCEICNVNHQTALLTKCCKLFICESCKDKYEKIGSCVCAKPIYKKLCSLQSQLFEIISNFHDGKPQQCYRCSQTALVNCKDCDMLFCDQCNNQVHSGAGYAKHIRSPYKFSQAPQKNLQRLKRKQQWCPQHKIIFDSICQCGTILCQHCVRSHRDNCNKNYRIRLLKQYKEQYFSQMLIKIKQIIEYKQKLKQEKTNYENHFMKQKQIYQTCEKSIDQQLQGLKKILEIKAEEIKQKLGQYWAQCQNIYRKNVYIMDFNLKKFDDYSRMVEKFAEQTIGLDYLEKRIKKVNIGYDFFNFKTLNIEDVQSSILNLNIMCKNWEINNQENILLNLDTESGNGKDKKVDLIGNVNANSQILLEITQNPKNPRPLTLISSHNSIFFQFLHLAFQEDDYQVGYGVGLRMKGEEIFKKVANKNGKGIIQGLNPSTKYRVRMRVGGGQWGQVQEVKTQEMPKFIVENTYFSHLMGDNSIQIVRPGTIYGNNEIYFGIHSWQIKINSIKASYDQSQRSCISIGVSNKEHKRPVFVGSTLNYGYHKSTLVVKVTVNCQSNKLTITNSSTNQEQVYQNLPGFPIYPAIQNKQNNFVQIQYNFL